MDLQRGRFAVLDQPRSSSRDSRRARRVALMGAGQVNHGAFDAWHPGPRAMMRIPPGLWLGNGADTSRPSLGKGKQRERA